MFCSLAIGVGRAIHSWLGGQSGITATTAAVLEVARFRDRVLLAAIAACRYYCCCCFAIYVFLLLDCCCCCFGGQYMRELQQQYHR